jgi:chromosome condensin MukBEF ATPase and DNA-binding subunit MukB
VAVTSLGRRVLQRSRTRKTAYLAHRLRGLSEEDLGVLRDAVAVLEHLVEDDASEEER